MSDSLSTVDITVTTDNTGEIDFRRSGKDFMKNHIACIINELFRARSQPDDTLHDVRHRIQKTCFILDRFGLLNPTSTHPDYHYFPLDFKEYYGYTERFSSEDLYFMMGVLRKEGYLTFPHDVKAEDSDTFLMAKPLPSFEFTPESELIRKIAEILAGVSTQTLRIVAYLFGTGGDLHKAFRYEGTDMRRKSILYANVCATYGEILALTKRHGRNEISV